MRKPVYLEVAEEEEVLNLSQIPFSPLWDDVDPNYPVTWNKPEDFVAFVLRALDLNYHHHQDDTEGELLLRSLKQRQKKVRRQQQQLIEDGWQ